jgi:Na+/proline symporter
LALGLSVQLIPALAGVCWLPWITRDGASVGLVAGAFAVLITEPLGGTICRLLGFELPWGRWPWTIHSAGWGIMVNIVFCVVVSWISNYKVELAQRQKYHRIFTETAAMPKNQRFLRPVAWSFTLIWFFFAVGPGAVLGNDLFGAPNAGLAEWIGGIPSLWLWQLVWWALGVMVLWLLAYPMRMASRPSFEQMEVIVHESPG